jgi:pyruvate ferredoxin oxidoreductase alpha subunit
MVKSGELANCEFINVESEFAALSVAIGASARVHVPIRPRQPGTAVHGGSVYNARTRSSDSDDHRQPGDRSADQYLERPFRQHVDARRRMDPALRGDQPEALDLHPGVQAGRGTLLSGHGVHGRLHPDPRLRPCRRADAGRCRRVPAAIRARQVLDPADPVSMGAMVGPEAFTEVRYLAHHKQLRASS